MSYYPPYHDDRGLVFVRAALMLARERGNAADAVSRAESTFGLRSVEAAVIRAAVGTLTPASPGWGDALGEAAAGAAQEFFEVVRGRSLIGRLGMREVAFAVPLVPATDGAAAAWLGEGGEMGLEALDLTLSRLTVRKVAALAVISAELAALSQAERLVRDDLASALAARIDETFASADAAVDGVSPAGIALGAVTIAASGNTRADLARLVSAFPGDPTRAVFVARPELYAAWSGADFPGLGLGDGELLNRPALATIAVEEDTTSPVTADLLMIDPTAVAFAALPPVPEASRHATIRIDGQLVSMWQANMLALRAVQPINWEAQRPAVARLTGIEL